MYSHFIKLECMPSPLCHSASVQEVLPGSRFSKVTKSYGTFEKIMGPRAQKSPDVLIGFCTLCFCFPTKMLHLNAPFFPLKCSVSPKKSLKCSDNAHYTNGFLKINFKVYTYKNVQVTTTTCTSS